MNILIILVIVFLGGAWLTPPSWTGVSRTLAFSFTALAIGAMAGAYSFLYILLTFTKVIWW
jgi:hypothetical protein